MKRFEYIIYFLAFFLITVANIFGLGQEDQATTQKDQPDIVVLKYAHGDPPDSPDGKTHQLVADKIMERSNGRIEVIVYPSEQLGSLQSMIEGVQIGTIDITQAPGVTLTSYSKSFGIDAIPYLFDDNDAFKRMIIDTGMADDQARALEGHGLVVLNRSRNFFKGPYRVLYSKKPIQTLADFNGLRFRAFQNKNYIRAYETLGANPIVLPWGETYMGLKQGIVEAGAGNMSQIRGMGFTEVAPYVVRTNEYFSNVLFLMNGEKFHSLSEEDQKILFDCFDEAYDDMKRLQQEVIDRDIQWMKDNHDAVFLEIDTGPIRKKLKDYYYSLEAEGVLPVGTVDAAFSVEES